jgi:glycosyltransferase involved in cell wall biosynthesis
MAKKKIVLFSDSPYATTGLARQVRYFLKMFPEYEWHMWAINHGEFVIQKNQKIAIMPDSENFPKPASMVTPNMVNGDMYQASQFPQFIDQVKPDYVMTFIDFDRVFPAAEAIKKMSIRDGFKWIHYMNVDRYNYGVRELTYFHLPDYLVTTAKFGAERLEQQGLNREITSIYHALDADEFPLLKRTEIRQFRKEAFGKKSNKEFIVGSVNRVFARKDPVRLINAFNEFNKKDNESKLYMHGNRQTYEGVDLAMVGDVMRWDMETIMFPPNFNETTGVSQEQLNKIYQSFDVVASTSTGEGFGFSTLEALLTERPMIAPDNTTFPEFLTDYGYIVPTSDWVFVYGQYSTPWKIVDEVKFAETLQHIKDNYDEAKEKAKAGRKFVLETFNLDVIKNQWSEILR